MCLSIKITRGTLKTNYRFLGRNPDKMNQNLLERVLGFVFKKSCAFNKCPLTESYVRVLSKFGK